MKKFQDGRHWEQNALKVLSRPNGIAYKSFNKIDKINLKIYLNRSFCALLTFSGHYEKKQDGCRKKNKTCLCLFLL